MDHRIRIIFEAPDAEKICGFIGEAPFWTPSIAQVQELEPLLPQYLATHPPSDDKPVTNFNLYGRQYIGVTKNRQKVIYLNAFCRPERFGERCKKEPILVDDGGSCYFQVYFNPGTKEFIHLNYNGQA